MTMINEETIVKTINDGLEKVVKDLLPDVVETKVKEQVEPVVKKIEEVETQVKDLAKSFYVRKTTKTDEQIEKIGKLFKALARGDFAEAKTLTEGVAADGGYLVPPEYERDLVKVITQYGIARKYARKIPMGSDTKYVNTLAGSVTAYIVGENTAITQSQPSFGQKKLEAKKFAALIEATQELIDDSMSNQEVFNLVLELTANEFAKLEDQELFNGNGTGFNGILNDSDVEIYSLATGNTSITNITGDDFISVLYNKATKYWKGKNPRWYMNASIWGVVRKLKDSNGNYIVGDLGSDTTPAILGIPVEFTDVLPGIADDAADKAFIVFGDLNFYALGVRKGITAEMGYVSGGFERDAKALKIIERVAGTPLVPEAFTVIKTAAS